MLIGENYKIETDNMNVTLLKKGKTKDGNEYYRPIAYLYDLNNALKYLVDLEVYETGLKDLKTVIKKQEELYQLINSLKLS